MRAYWGVEVQLHAFLTSTLGGGEWSVSRPCYFTPGGRSPGTHWIGARLGSRADLDTVAKRKNPIITPGVNWSGSKKAGNVLITYVSINLKKKCFGYQDVDEE
jgi:hypothetical protein